MSVKMFYLYSFSEFDPLTILDLGSMSGPVLLFGGPYSNLQATRAMRATAERLAIPPGNIICNGDVVAYCGEPEQTVNLIRDWGIHTVMGNCEESVGEQQDDCGCGFEADTLCSVLSVEWYRYVSAAVSNDSRQWMRQLPGQIRFESAGIRCTVIHGGVGNMSEFVFLSSSSEKKRRDAERIDTDCVIGGHCGIPFGQKIAKHASRQEIANRYWLNTGVIGMPANDGTRDGWYLLLEPGQKPGNNENRIEQLTASWHRLQFNNEEAAMAMKVGGLGSAYRDALLSGLWPSMDILPNAEREARNQPLSLPPLELNRFSGANQSIDAILSDQESVDTAAATAR